MVDAVYSALLNSSADIQRFTSTGVDAHGQPTGAWANSSTGIKCRIRELAGVSNANNEIIDSSGTAVVASHEVWLLPGVSITEKDRVVHGGITYDVQFVVSRPGGTVHHVKAYLKVAR